MKIYLASGFFNLEQNTTVTYLEELCRSLTLPYYSPRTESFDFNDEELQLEVTKDRVDQTKDSKTVTVKVDLKDSNNSQSVTFREAAVRAIFANNIRRMNECTHMYANFQKNDTGTVFEVGYFIAEDLAHLTINRLLLKALEAQANNLRDDMGGLYFERMREAEIEIQMGIKNINDKLEVFFDEGNVVGKILTDPNYFINVIDSFGVQTSDGNGKIYSTPNFNTSTQTDLDVNEIEMYLVRYFRNDIRFICTDDYPVQNILALGMFTKLGAPIVTYSERGYGSNVMLATCSTHYNTKADLEADVYNHAIFDSNSDILKFNQFYVAKVAYGEFDFTQEID